MGHFHEIEDGVAYCVLPSFMKLECTLHDLITEILSNIANKRSAFPRVRYLLREQAWPGMGLFADLLSVVSLGPDSSWVPVKGVC